MKSLPWPHNSRYVIYEDGQVWSSYDNRPENLEWVSYSENVRRYHLLKKLSFSSSHFFLRLMALRNAADSTTISPILPTEGVSVSICCWTVCTI